MKKITVLTSLLMAASLIGTACVEKETVTYEGLKSFKMEVNRVEYVGGKFVDVPYGGLGTADHRLPFSGVAENYLKDPNLCLDQCTYFKINAVARDAKGEEIKYNGKLKVKVQPGDVYPDIVEMKDGVLGRTVAGKFEPGVYVHVRRAFGNANIWLEDSAGGLVDENGTQHAETLSTGTSKTIHYDWLTIKDIQYNSDSLAADSPMLYKYADVRPSDGRDLVVTNIVQTGFYVADLSSDSFESLFIFTFKQPEKLRIGDRVCELAGGVAEFNGMTQLQFPSYGIQNKERSSAEEHDPVPEDGDEGLGSCLDIATGRTRPCTPTELLAKKDIVDCRARYPKTVAKIDARLKSENPDMPEEERMRLVRREFAFLPSPTPKIINAEHLKISGNILVNADLIEKMEGSIVTVKDVYLSKKFIDCDDNGNSKIESGTAEADCRTTCQNNIGEGCTELSSYNSYGQWRGFFKREVGGKLVTIAEISVANTELISGFDVIKDCERSLDADGRVNYDCKGDRKLLSITGNLKQIIPTCAGKPSCDASKSKFPILVIEPRYQSDIVLDPASK